MGQASGDSGIVTGWPYNNYLPVNFAATHNQGRTEDTLKWADNDSDATTKYYNVSRREDGVGAFVFVERVDVSGLPLSQNGRYIKTFTLAGTDSGKTFEYQVCAAYGSGDGMYESPCVTDTSLTLDGEWRREIRDEEWMCAANSVAPSRVPAETDETVRPLASRVGELLAGSRPCLNESAGLCRFQDPDSAGLVSRVVVERSRVADEVSSSFSEFSGCARGVWLGATQAADGGTSGFESCAVSAQSGDRLLRQRATQHNYLPEPIDPTLMLPPAASIGWSNPTWEVSLIWADHLGSTRVVSSINADRITRHSLYPFGEGLGSTPDYATKEFTGHERDREARLDYMFARYYDQSLGHFLSPDPIGPSRSTPQAWNKYAYVRNKPLTFIDPNGAEDVSPVRLGLEWVSGLGRRDRTFDGQDEMTRELAEHGYVEERRQQMSTQIRHGIYDSTEAWHNLGGLEGAITFTRDYLSLLTGGGAGSLTSTYLGSYYLHMEVVRIDPRTGEVTVEFTAWNDSTFASGFRLPVLGYTSLYRNYFTPVANGIVDWIGGPMSTTTQTLYWTEHWVLGPLTPDTPSN